MKRFTLVSAFALVLCLIFSGFATHDRQDTNVEPLTIHITSDAGEAGFEAWFKSENGFAVSANDGVTPATFTVKAERFEGIIRAKQDASISVKASRGSATASRTQTSAIRVVRNAEGFSVSGIEDEE